MPRANRTIQPGCLYHLTHRCHDRKFLLRFGTTRDRYRERLRAAVKEFRVPLLDYCLTSNHTHLLAEAPVPRAISRMMQKLEGEFAQWYNGRGGRSGAFWEDRYHCTLVDSGEYAWNCLRYIDMNMVRAGVVSHPSQWRWCGYDELTGRRQRYRLLDLDCVSKWLGGMDRPTLFREYRQAIERAIEDRDLARNPIWTEGLAVGSREFIGQVCGRIRNRARFRMDEVTAGIWTVRDPRPAYSPFPGGKNGF